MLGDQDSFLVRLRRGHEYRFEIEGSDYLAPYNYYSYFSLPRGSLQLLDAAGSALVSSDDGGLTFRPQTDGDYYLTARGSGVFAGANYSDIGPYALSAREATDDAPEGPGTPLKIPLIGYSLTGTLESSGDTDSIDLPRMLTNSGYVVEVRGAAADGALQKPTLQVFSPAGTLLAADSNADGGPSAQVTVRPTGVGSLAEDYYVTVGGVGSAAGDTYSVGIRETTDDYTAGPATAGVLAVGGSTRGNIEWDLAQLPQLVWFWSASMGCGESTTPHVYWGDW